MEPVLGLAGDYASNPVLLNISNTAEGHGAVLLDAPTIYTADDFKLSILPAVRLGNNDGYSSLDSDYEHLNAKAELDAARNVFTVAAGINRDSSVAIFTEPNTNTVAYNGLLDGRVGVARTSDSGDVNWDRLMTERIDMAIDVSSMRVRYDEPASPASLDEGPPLIGYTYTSIAPTLKWATSERGKLIVSADVGRYNSTNGARTESSTINFQVGYNRQLSEVWSLSTTAGYSRSIDKVTQTGDFIELTPSGYEVVQLSQNLESAQDGSLYSINLSRQTKLLSLSLAASRQLVPSGYAYLSRQDTYALSASYLASERWTLYGNASWVKYQYPSIGEIQNPVTLVTSEYTTTSAITSGYLGVSAAWQWTERWSATFGASRVIEKPSPNVELHSNGLSVNLSRKFNRIGF